MGGCGASGECAQRPVAPLGTFQKRALTLNAGGCHCSPGHPLAGAGAERTVVVRLQVPDQQGREGSEMPGRPRSPDGQTPGVRERGPKRRPMVCCQCSDAPEFVVLPSVAVLY
jgi:hypothetical protein